MKTNRKRIWTLLVIFAMIVTMAVPAFAATDTNTYTSDAKKLATPATAGDDGYYTASVAYEDGYADGATEIVGQPKEGTGSIIIDLPEGEGAKGQTFTYKIYRVFDAAVSSDGTASYSPVNGATTVPSDSFTGTHTSDTGDLTYTYKFVLENGNVKLKYYDSDNSTWLDVDSAHQPNKDSAAFNEALGGAIKTYIDSFSETDPNPIPSLMEISVTDTNGDNDRLEITNLPLGYYYITTGAGTMVTINTTNTTATVKDKNTIEKPDKEITSVTNGDDDTERTDYSIYTDGDGHSHIGNAQIGDTVGFTGTVNIGQGAVNYTYKDLLSNGLTLVTTGTGTTDDPYVPTVTVTFKRKTGTDDSGNPIYQTGTIPLNGKATDDSTDPATEITTWVTPDNSADNYTVAYQGNYSGTDPEPAAGSTTFTVAFDNALLENFSADDEIYVNYSAVLNKNAKVGSEGNPNEAWLSYGNDPDGGHDTETTTTTTYTGKVTVTKTDGASPAHYIEGASFVLQNKTAADGSKYTGASGQTATDETNKYYKWDEVNGKVVWVASEDDATVFTSKLLWQDSDGNIYYEQGDTSLGRTPVYATDSEGNVLTDSEGNSIQKGAVVATVQDADGNDVIIDSFKGLPVGHFLLHETVTPAGYNTAADEELEIKKVTENTGEEGYPNDTWDNTIELSRTVQNLKGFNFPSTGGIGTKILYAAGAALIAAAIIIIAVRKRKQADK